MIETLLSLPSVFMSIVVEIVVEVVVETVMEKVLVSACLLGQPVRYNGTSKQSHHIQLQQWLEQGRLVPVCPELEGGLSVPRPPAEIVEGFAGDVIDGTAEVETINGQEVTDAFMNGAQRALLLCQNHRVKLAVLTEGSPSCGTSEVYDGTFSGQKISGMGITSAVLERHGIRVFSQHQIKEAGNYLRQLERQ